MMDTTKIVLAIIILILCIFIFVLSNTLHNSSELNFKLIQERVDTFNLDETKDETNRQLRIENRELEYNNNKCIKEKEELNNMLINTPLQLTNLINKVGCVITITNNTEPIEFPAYTTSYQSLSYWNQKDDSITDDDFEQNYWIVCFDDYNYMIRHRIN